MLLCAVHLIAAASTPGCVERRHASGLGQAPSVHIEGIVAMQPACLCNLCTGSSVVLFMHVCMQARTVNSSVRQGWHWLAFCCLCLDYCLVGL